MSDPSPRTAILVSHTHWDRAWYLPFEAFRFRLVRMVDRLLDLLESDPAFHSFTLDGQTILLDDYLRQRPENEARLRALIGSGRLICGPWFVLPDLFLVSPESVVRNLQIGMRMGGSFGGVMREGYVPDPFGHFAQLPQILNGFGLTSFLFMRGLGEDDKRRAGTVFRWAAPDGSEVLTHYMIDGYFNAASLGYPTTFGRHDGLTPDPEKAAAQIRETLDKLAPLQQESVFLLNNGFDHMPEEPRLPGLLDEIRSRIPDLDLRHGTFADFVAAVRAESRSHQVVEGDLLGNADHPILSSVFSTRVYLKQQNHRAQSLLERVVEPLLAFSASRAGHADTAFAVADAWKRLLSTHPHDDICGCSHDAVHEDDEAAFRHVHEIGESLITEALETMRRSGLVAPPSTDARSSDVFVFNPHPWQTTQRIRTRIHVANPEAEQGVRLPEEHLAAVDGHGNPIPLLVIGTVPHILRNRFLESTWSRAYDVEFDIMLPPLGYQIVHIHRTDRPGATPPPLVPDPRLAAFRDSLMLEFRPDLGDTYTFGPDPDGLVVEAPLRDGGITVPRKPGSDERVRLEVDTAFEQRHGSARLRLTYRNLAENGRLRLAIPLPSETDHVLADGHFRIARRDRTPLRTPEQDPDRHGSYPGEFAYPTFHIGDFVLVPYGSRWMRISTRGLHEAELGEVDGKPAFLLTLHRSVGELSVGGGRLRRVQAGPQIPTHGAQCLRELHHEIWFGLEPDADGAAFRRGRERSHPVFVREMPYLPHLKAGTSVPRVHSLLHVPHPDVQLSALRHDEATGDRILRLFNLGGTDLTTSVGIDIQAGHVCETDLLEGYDAAKALAFIDGTIPVRLKPHGILTLRIRPA
jgi:mannosylglycerate hydrolase